MSLDLKPPLLRWKGTDYAFSERSLLVFIIACPVAIFLLVIFFDLEFNAWFPEIVARQASFVANLWFNVPSSVIADPAALNPWRIIVSGTDFTLVISPGCAATIQYAFAGGILLLVPANQLPGRKTDFMWRKGKALIFFIVVVYFINLLRMALLIYSTSGGFFQEMHDLLNILTGITGGVLLAVSVARWTPEFFALIFHAKKILKPQSSKE